MRLRTDSPPVNSQAVRPAQSGVYNRPGMWPISPSPHNLRWPVPVRPKNIPGKAKLITAQCNISFKAPTNLGLLCMLISNKPIKWHQMLGKLQISSPWPCTNLRRWTQRPYDFEPNENSSSLWKIIPFVWWLKLYISTSSSIIDSCIHF